MQNNRSIQEFFKIYHRIGFQSAHKCEMLFCFNTVCWVSLWFHHSGSFWMHSLTVFIATFTIPPRTHHWWIIYKLKKDRNFFRARLAGIKKNRKVETRRSFHNHNGPTDISNPSISIGLLVLRQSKKIFSRRLPFVRYRFCDSRFLQFHRSEPFSYTKTWMLNETPHCDNVHYCACNRARR